MRNLLRSTSTAVLLASALWLPIGAMASTQNQAPQPLTSSAGTSAEPAPKPEADNETNQFRHAGPVQAIARTLHISTETAAQIFEDLNSGILILLILFFLARVLPKAIRGRTATIQKQLVEARSATETANERLTAVEAKLAKLGDEIEAIRHQTERDMVEDEKRIKRSLEDERQRIVKSAEQEIDSAGAAAQRELKRFAADLAIDKAVQKIQLTAESDKTIVERFGQDLIVQFGKGARN